MVNFDALSKITEQLSIFFSEIIESNTTSSIDKKSAAYGLEAVSRITQLMRQYENKPSQAFLKGLYGALMSVSRGVEGFIDLDLNAAFVKKANGIYDIMVDLQKNIKW